MLPTLAKLSSATQTLIKGSLLLLLAVMTFSPMFSTGFLTRDDAERHLEVLTGGIFGGIWGIVETSGRLTLAVHIFLTHIPYLSDDFVYPKIFLIASHVLIVSYFGYVLGKYSNSRTIALLFLVFFLVFLTNSWEHNLYASYPFAFHVSMAAAIGSSHFLYLYRVTGKRFNLNLSAISYGFAISAYEQFTIYAFFYLGLLFFWKRPFASNGSKALLRDAIPFFITIFIYVVLVIGFKILVPGKYEGTELASFNIQGFFTTLKTFILSSFPVYIPLSNEGLIAANISGYELSLVRIFDSFRWVWLAKVMVAAVLITWALRTSDHRSGRASTISLAATLLLLLVLSVLLVSVSAKYQDWVLNHNVRAYSSSSYSAQLCAAALVAVLACAVGRTALIRKLNSGEIFVGAVLLISPVIAVTEHHNDNILAWQRNAANKWLAIDSFVTSGVLRSMPAGSIIYSQEFMQAGGIASMREGYWGTYLGAKHGIDVDITSHLNKYYRPEYFGKRYVISYRSKYPHNSYHAKILEVTEKIYFVDIPNDESTGFYAEEKDVNGVIYRWSKKSSSLSLCNSSNENENLEFMVKARSDGSRVEPLKICLLGECRDYLLAVAVTQIRERRVFPPGCSPLTFNTSARPVLAPLDSRNLYFQLFDFEFKEKSP
jgi:hypothetical protein